MRRRCRINKKQKRERVMFFGSIFCIISKDTFGNILYKIIGKNLFLRKSVTQSLSPPF